jgi:hypothetical protein
MFSYGEDNEPMAGFEHLLKSYDVGDLLDDIASSDPPAYLRRCFAEGSSSPTLTLPRIQQLGVCGMVLDAILNDRDYGNLEPELIADWRAHYGQSWEHMKDTAVAALRRASEQWRAQDSEVAAELEELEHRLAPA